MRRQPGSFSEWRRRNGWTVLRTAHLLAGIGGFYAFGRTGLFMDQQLDHLVGMLDAPRALYRSAHMYILLAALLHSALGLYLKPSQTLPGRIAQLIGSALLFTALYHFWQGFWVETPLAVVERPHVRQGIYDLLNGMTLHGCAVLVFSWLPDVLWEMMPVGPRQWLKDRFHRGPTGRRD